MSERKKYKGFDDWQSTNLHELQGNYKADHEELKKLYEYPAFDDYCCGIWQRLD